MARRKTRTMPTINHRGSLMTTGFGEHETCLSYIWDAGEHGFYEPNFGRIDVTKEEAETHNRLYSEALIKGLDERCEVGQCGTFYIERDAAGRYLVKTWTGELVSDDTSKSGFMVVFRRGGKEFQGRPSAEGAFNFERIA